MTDNPTDSAVTDAMTLTRRLQLVYDWLEERGQRYHCQTLDIVMSQASPPPEDFNMPTIGDHILMILGQYRDDMPPDAVKAFQQIAALAPIHEGKPE